MSLKCNPAWCFLFRIKVKIIRSLDQGFFFFFYLSEAYPEGVSDPFFCTALEITTHHYESYYNYQWVLIVNSLFYCPSDLNAFYPNLVNLVKKW